MKTKKTELGIFLRGIFLFSLLAFSIVSIYFATAVPQGAEIASNTTTTAGSTTPGNRTDDGGTITTLVLNTVQQNQQWKGYVGNVTGKLSLDDADGFTIYDWEFGGAAISGEVYATRASSPSWSSVSCANSTNLNDAETFHNMTASDADSITNTFNYTLHDSFIVGGTGGPNNIVNSTCPSTATYVNDTVQAMSTEAGTYFQEVIVKDASDNLLYVTILEDDYDSYRTVSNGTYDFQMIVPESDVKASATTYYFFLEIG